MRYIQTLPRPRTQPLLPYLLLLLLMAALVGVVLAVLASALPPIVTTIAVPLCACAGAAN